MQFLELNDTKELSELESLSFKKAQVIFKHSTRCIISKMALKRLQAGPSLDISVWVLDLLAHRELSNTIASKYTVFHQSPQIIIIKNGIAIANTSHERIETSFIQSKL